MSAVAPICGICFQSDVNPNFRDQLSILSAVAPIFGIFSKVKSIQILGISCRFCQLLLHFLGIFFLEEFCRFSNSVQCLLAPYCNPNSFSSQPSLEDQRRPLTQLFFEKIILPFVANKYMQILVFLCWLHCVILSGFYVKDIKQGLEQSRIGNYQNSWWAFIHKIFFSSRICSRIEVALVYVKCHKFTK